MIKKLLSLLGGYALATLAQGLVGLLAVPLLLHIFSASNFTYWVLLEPIVAMMAGLIWLGSQYGVLHAIPVKKIKANQVPHLFYKFASGPAFFILLVGVPSVCLLLNLMNKGFLFVAILIVYVFCEGLILLSQFLSRAKADSVSFAITVWVRSGGLLLLLLVLNKFDIKLELITFIFLMSLLDCIVLVFIALRKNRFTLVESLLSPSDYWGLVKYGIPFVVSGALTMMAGNMDRYVLNHSLAAEELASYLILAKIAGAMNFAIAPVNLWWPVARHLHVSDPDAGSMFFKSAYSIILGFYLFSAVVLFISASYLLPWYAPGLLIKDESALAVLLLAWVAQAMGSVMNVGALSPGKTHLVLVSSVIAVLVGLCASLLLTAKWPFYGAAAAVLISQLIGLILNCRISQKIQYVEIPYIKMLLLVLSSSFVTSVHIKYGSVEVDVLVGCVLGLLFLFILKRDIFSLQLNKKIIE
ncbi:lipopolysaccharide biosynthesis protein [Iodobacter sp.]|uniref:lipopolysaccharide biosynthesis protein n=1 Tax=Iodobacter sp. TaxID=1915058 RepID=UPI0025FE971E|nr:polysaccharide biosynthesis C-terminal domain-containing protein [Iodobacter sp.]